MEVLLLHAAIRIPNRKHDHKIEIFLILTIASFFKFPEEILDQNERANGLELRRRGTHSGYDFPPHCPTQSIANRAASPVASSEMLGGWILLFRNLDVAASCSDHKGSIIPFTNPTNDSDIIYSANDLPRNVYTTVNG